MKRLSRMLRKTLLASVASAIALALGVFLLLRASLPQQNGTLRLAGFKAPVSIQYDGLGVPNIHAESREDGYRALGLAAARDRLFQMDLLRRSAAGRLSEIFGESTLKADEFHRRMGFEPLARKIFEGLPDSQKSLLRAYSEGVNEAMAQMPVYPFEFLLLFYDPKPWSPEDSLLVVLGMFDMLTAWAQDSERMATVMEASLDGEVVDFFTPDSDRYTDSLVPGKPRRPAKPLPKEKLQALLDENAVKKLSGLAGTAPFLPGSNGWLAAPGKTFDGRAILANDMHLTLQVPNVWYRAQMQVGESLLAGISLPGAPLFVSASNGHIAWGFTNTAGDFLDLVLLDKDLKEPGAYLTPQGPKRFEKRIETLKVRGGQDKKLEVAETIWGPVLEEPLLGHAVALRWTLLDPASTDLSLAELADARDASEALAIFNRAGGPPLNALVADSIGNIAWTYSGKIPVRQGHDGLVSRSWSDGRHGWKGYVASAEMPRIVNPPKGYLVNANQRMLGEEYPYVIGQDFNNGYRAYRIGERLEQMQGVGEKDLFMLQLDAKVDFYRFYQKLALEALDGAPAGEQWQALKNHLESWDGHAEKDSKGLALLIEFRKRLADASLSPFMARCRNLDPAFVYRWGNMDEPLKQLLEAKPPELLPPGYLDWKAFILAQLQASSGAVSGLCGGLARQEWGCLNRVNIGHLFSYIIPALAPFLDMPKDPLPGCGDCVRMALPSEGASERLVVAPGHENNAIFQMPAGQSGHPLSPSYSDEQRLWLEGIAGSLLAGKTQATLEILPEQQPSRPDANP